jgi:hypothetical protein
MVSKQRQTTTTEFKPKISFQNYRKQLFSLFSCLHENNEAWSRVETGELGSLLSFGKWYHRFEFWYHRFELKNVRFFRSRHDTTEICIIDCLYHVLGAFLTPKTGASIW